MTTYQTSIVAGVFRDTTQAQRAVESLRSAGFKYDQVGVAMRTAPNATPNLHDDLMKLGVPDDMATFYEKEYQAGNIVVSIRPDGRDTEARDMLRQFGAYDHTTSMNTLGSQTQNAEGPMTYNQQDPTRKTWGESEQPGQDATSQTPDEYRQGQSWNPAMGNPRPEDRRPNP